MSSKFKFSNTQKDNIKAAVADLESASSGEIVPYITHRSDNYEEARWKSAVILSLLGAITLGVLSYSWMLPFAITPLEDAIFVAVLMLMGFFIPVVWPGAIRFLVSEERMHLRVMHEAETVFLEEEIFKTVDRTGVLIYISELEHEVVVLADSGINQKVKPQDWERVNKLVVEGIKQGKTDEGLINAIKECKKLLLENGFTVRPDDTNELSDDLRIN